MTRPKA